MFKTDHAFAGTHCLLCSVYLTEPSGNLKKDSDRTQEHVIPKWYWKDTGNKFPNSRDVGGLVRKQNGYSFWIPLCNKCNNTMNDLAEKPVRKMFTTGEIPKDRWPIALWVAWIMVKSLVAVIRMGNGTRKDFEKQGVVLLEAVRLSLASGHSVPLDGLSIGVFVGSDRESFYAEEPMTHSFTIGLSGLIIVAVADGGFNTNVLAAAEECIRGIGLAPLQARDLCFSVGAYSTMVRLGLGTDLRTGITDLFYQSCWDESGDHYRYHFSKRALLDSNAPLLALLYDSGVRSTLFDGSGRFLQLSPGEMGENLFESPTHLAQQLGMKKTAVTTGVMTPEGRSGFTRLSRKLWKDVITKDGVVRHRASSPDWALFRMIARGEYSSALAREGRPQCPVRKLDSVRPGLGVGTGFMFSPEKSSSNGKFAPFYTDI